MAKLKHTFVRGRMNKDIDERMVPNGEYRDALNIQVATSEGSNVGAIENILGNTKKNLKALPSTEWYLRFGLTNPICIGGTRDVQNDKIYWFVTSDSVDTILEYDKATNIVAPILVDTQGVLNFSADYLITGINILDGMLFWTDNLNEPRKINIATFKAGSDQGASLIFNTHTQVYGRNFIASDITIIKLKPNSAPSYTASSTSRAGSSVGLGINTVTTNKNLTEEYPTGSGVYVPVEVGSTVTFTTSAAPNWVNNDIVVLTASEINDYNNEDEYQARLKITNVSGANITAEVQSISSNLKSVTYEWTCVLEEEKPMWEFSFPRFAYRWKYNESEYSAFSPWTQAVFVADKFKYSSLDAYNLGMTNNLRKLTLSGFETPPADVVEVEILYKDSSSNEIYKVDTIASTSTTFDISSELIYHVISSDQLLRPYDNVPRKAKAQEITANRLIYGNYLQNYNVSEVSLTPSISSVDITTVGKPESSLKSIRTYQVGIVYIDDNGRETPVFTNDTATIAVNKNLSSKVNALQVTSAQSAPSFADKFKYYVKETSSEYYNLVLDRYYASEDGNVWLSFPSAERNKLQEGDYIELKKKHNSDDPVNGNARYKVLDISNEAPEFIKTKKRYLTSNVITKGSVNPVGTSKRTFKFIGPDLQTNEKFLNAFVENVFIRFRSGTNITAFYEVESGGYTGDSLNSYEVTLTELLDDDASWINSLGSTVEFTCELYQKRTDNLAEYQGRFFAKINRDVVFEENVIYNFTNNPSDYEIVQNTTIATVQNTLQDNPDNDTDTPIALIDRFGWAENAGANNPSVTIFGKPQLNSFEAGFAFAPYDPLVPNFGTNGNAFDAEIQQGSVIQFKDATTGEWSSLYEVASVVKGQYDRQFPDVGATNDETGYYWNITLATAFKDENWDAESIRIMQRKRLLTSQFDEDSVTLSSFNPAIFETEPKESADLNIYYEACDAQPIADLRNIITLPYFNCYSFGNGAESDRIRDDYNAKTISKGVKASSTLDEPYAEERRDTGLIYSGIYNSISGVNNLNQFIAGLGITKDLEPIYGSIQKLYARDTSLVAFCEDKVFRILADKDALYNADGNVNLVSTNRVLGEAATFAGEFGISKNPESFAQYGFRVYFADKARGAVLRLSNDGLTEISEKGMTDFFVDAFAVNATPVIGSFDESTSAYNIKLNNESVSYKERVDGWPTRLSFDPEFAVSLNNEYYTFKNGEIWEHSNETRNNFYGSQESSQVTVVFNDAPSSIKNFKTLSYEGTERWTAAIATDKQNGTISTWRDNEGIYHNFIKGENLSLAVVNGQLNSKDFSVQGIGEITAHIPGVPYTIEVGGNINTSLSINDTLYIKRGTAVLAAGPVTNIVSNRVAFTDSGVAPQVGEYAFFLKSNAINTSGLLGYYANVTFTNADTDFAELFAINSEVFISSE